MVQHVLLTLVAAPLIALSAPITLVLRLVSPATRRRWILPVLHSRVTRILAFPVVAWVIFAACHVGQPLLAAVRRGARGSADPRPGARAVPWRGACSSGGRPSRSTRRRGACPTRPVPCTSSSRCRRTRSWPSCCSSRRPCSTRITRRSQRDLGADGPRRTSRRPPGSCGSPATRSSSSRSWRSCSAGCAPRRATSGARTGARRPSWPTSASANGVLAERLAHEREDGQPGSGASR